MLAAPELAHRAGGSLSEEVRALAADSPRYRQRAIDTLAGWGEDITPFQQYRHTPAEIGAHAEAFADDPPF
ncbi:hypothetical protein [Streptomyces sp. ID05-47C]|uniref:hypothetical protein n=1 Tax=Streptomyces sp. ID05-47C TaxID=3028665 RepID=UPI0029A8DFAC|nr:hypothetical protein [Streptomyces sp. ID05-47C]MDX3572722.1 hypothetical protein [Streptomyces sp. ID05-47C]